MPINVTTWYSTPTLQRALHGPAGVAARATLRRGKRVEAGAKRRVRVDTGRLRASIHTELRQVAGLWITRVGTDVSYAASVHNGTGIYGSRKTPIRPLHAQVLIFRPRGSARIVVAREVRGQRPNRFLTDALKDA